MRHATGWSRSEDPTVTPKNKSTRLALVVSANLHRRHLNESQRAIIADDLARLKVGNPSIAPMGAIGMTATQAEAARLLKVGRGSVQRARRVRERGVPELMAAVRA